MAEYFDAPQAFRAWLEAHHETATEIVVGYHKKATGRPSMTWAESVDEALCFGWIDGVRRRVDEARYTIRFTPRKPGSIWSEVNVARATALLAEGRMRPAGMKAFEARSAARTGVYSYERDEEAALPPEMEKRFRASPKAWAFFQEQAPWYRRTALHWVTSAKREATRESRLAQLMEHSAAGRRVPAFDRQKKT